MIGIGFSGAKGVLAGAQRALDFLGIACRDLVEPAKLCAAVGVAFDGAARRLRRAPS